MRGDPARRPHTLVPPPLVYAIALGGAWWLRSRLPWPLDPGGAARPLGWALIALGLAGFAWALAAIRFRQTTVNPYKAASCLVTHGPFRYSRNPIYLADWFVYAGTTLLLGTAWPLLFAPLVFLAMRYLVIDHEERHLEARFGDEYRAYKARVRRWL